MRNILKISKTVQQAINHHQPILALESTIVAHGMPYPQNLQCALTLQNNIRKHGVQPATIAVFNGSIHVGIDQHILHQLAKQGNQVLKVSRRDLPYVLMNKQMGATTVSATMVAAALAGIQVFVTGGIGGVHREYSQTMDVSADLRQLGRTSVTVVSAGVKSILDIRRTLQYLQTEGVPVVTYGSGYFPAFFTASSGIASPLILKSPSSIAEMIMARKMLQMNNGMLVAVPTKDHVLSQELQKAISQAIQLAHQNNIQGAQITPYLLKTVNELTKGKSLQANVSLVLNNAQVGAQIASQLNKLQKQLKNTPRKQTYTVNINKQPKPGKLIAIGSCAIDYQYRALEGNKFELYKSCMGRSRKLLGGVARNIAQCARKINTETVLVSPLGNDVESNCIRQFCSNVSIHLKQINSVKHPTAKYLAILDEYNDEMMGISEMQINELLTFDNIYDAFFKQEINSNKVNTNDIVLIDANVDHHFQGQLQKLVKMCNEMGYFTIFECKGKKSNKIVKNNLHQYVSMIRMNKKEQIQLLKQMHKQTNSQDQLLHFASEVSRKNKATSIHKTGVSCIISNGGKPLKIISSNGKMQAKKVPRANVKKTTGAGDTFTGVLISMMLRGIQMKDAINYGLIGSRMTVESQNQQSVISSQLCYEKLKLQ